MLDIIKQSNNLDTKRNNTKSLVRSSSTYEQLRINQQNGLPYKQWWIETAPGGPNVQWDET